MISTIILCVEPNTGFYTFMFVLIDFWLTIKAETLIFISGRGPAISSAKQRKSGSIYNLVKNQ